LILFVKESGGRGAGPAPSQEFGRKKEEHFSLPCSLFPENPIEFNFVQLLILEFSIVKR
jgi:hypothetical protein